MPRIVPTPTPTAPGGCSTSTEERILEAPAAISADGGADDLYDRLMSKPDMMRYSRSGIQFALVHGAGQARQYTYAFATGKVMLQQRRIRDEKCEIGVREDG